MNLARWKQTFTRRTKTARTDAADLIGAPDEQSSIRSHHSNAMDEFQLAVGRIKALRQKIDAELERTARSGSVPAGALIAQCHDTQLAELAEDKWLLDRLGQAQDAMLRAFAARFPAPKLPTPPEPEKPAPLPPRKFQPLHEHWPASPPGARH